LLQLCGYFETITKILAIEAADANDSTSLATGSRMATNIPDFLSARAFTLIDASMQIY